jgi:hypothetical protein
MTLSIHGRSIMAEEENWERRGRDWKSEKLGPIGHDVNPRPEIHKIGRLGQPCRSSKAKHPTLLKAATYTAGHGATSMAEDSMETNPNKRSRSDDDGRAAPLQVQDIANNL